MNRRFSDAYDDMEEEQMEILQKCGTPCSLLLAFFIILFVYSILPYNVFLATLLAIAIVMMYWFWNL